MSIAALLICILSYLVIFLRWRTGANLWEALYAFPSGIMQGIILSGQFIGMSLSAPKDRVATAVGAYSLSQQLGLMLGTTAASAILQGVFGRTLLERLGGLPDKSEVSWQYFTSLLGPLHTTFGGAFYIFRRGTQMSNPTHRSSTTSSTTPDSHLPSRPPCKRSSAPVFSTDSNSSHVRNSLLHCSPCHPFLSVSSNDV